MSKDRKVFLRATDREVRAWQLAAGLAGQGLSEFLRRAAERQVAAVAVRYEPQQVKETTLQPA